MGLPPPIHRPHFPLKSWWRSLEFLGLGRFRRRSGRLFRGAAHERFVRRQRRRGARPGLGNSPKALGRTRFRRAGQRRYRFRRRERADLQADDFPALIRFAKETMSDLTVVGPRPLAAGIVRRLRGGGPAGLWPTPRRRRVGSQQGLLQGPARLADVPRPTTRSFPTPTTPLSSSNDRGRADRGQGRRAAAGKGVVVCSGRDEATRPFEHIARQKAFGPPATAW